METNQKKNVLQLVNGFGIGGAEKALLELVKRLDRNKYRTVVCGVGHGGPLEQEFTKYADRVIVFPKNFSFDITLVWKVAKLMRQERIDIVQSTLFYADIVGVFAARFAKVPVVISWQTALGLPSGHLHDDRLRHMVTYKFAVRHVDRIIAVSEDIKRFFSEKRKVNADKIITIPYGVDLNRFNKGDGFKKRGELGLNPSELVVGVVGHLTEVKGHTYLVEAAPRICKAFPDIRFLIVGGGPLRDSLQSRVKDLELSPNFLFLGVRQDIPELLNVMDIFVLPSLYEGLPNVILEAMACSKPVVGTSVGGIPEAVQDRLTGFLVPPQDPESLALAITKLLTDRDLAIKMGQNGRKRVEAYFSIEKEVERIQQLYEILFESKTNERKRDCRQSSRSDY